MSTITLAEYKNPDIEVITRFKGKNETHVEEEILWDRVCLTISLLVNVLLIIFS